jgi:hypothetical protein
MRRDPPGEAAPGPGDSTRIRALLDRIGVLRHPCDLDLLLFFQRHPRALLTSEQLAAYVGYGLAQIGDSLEVLVRARMLTRSGTQARSARMYHLVSGGPQGDWVASLLALVASREGQRQLRQALKGRSAETPAGRGRAKKPAGAARHSLAAVHART